MTRYNLTELAVQHGPVPDPAPGQGYATELNIPFPEGATFTDAFTNLFAPLTDWETANDREWEHTGPLTPERLLSTVGLDGYNLETDFGRFRSIGLELQTEGGPYVYVHTRNGGGNRDHWDSYDSTPGKDCDCPGCVQRYRITAYPNFAYDEDDDFDCTYANNYFRVPADTKDAFVQEITLNALHTVREAIGDNTLAPWSILTRNRAHELPYGFHDQKRRLDREYADMAAAVAEEDAVVAANPCPDIRPETRMVAAYGARGQRLRKNKPAREPRTWAVAVQVVTAAAEKVTKYETRLNELDQALDVDAVTGAARDLLAKERASTNSYLLAARTELEHAQQDQARKLYDLHHDRAARHERLAVLTARKAERDAQLDAVRNGWKACWPGNLTDCPAQPQQD